MRKICAGSVCSLHPLACAEIRRQAVYVLVDMRTYFKQMTQPTNLNKNTQKMSLVGG